MQNGKLMTVKHNEDSIYIFMECNKYRAPRVYWLLPVMYIRTYFHYILRPIRRTRSVQSFQLSIKQSERMEIELKIGFKRIIILLQVESLHNDAIIFSVQREIPCCDLLARVPNDSLHKHFSFATKKRLPMSWNSIISSSVQPNGRNVCFCHAAVPGKQETGAVQLLARRSSHEPRENLI